MGRVKTGIIGLGYWGPNVLRNFAALPECQMVWGCDLREENLAKAKAHYPALNYTMDAEDIFRDPAVDLVLITTPTTAHFPLAKRALEAGKHVFIEKPMTATVEEAEELVALAKAAKRHIFVDHTFVFAPAVEKIADLHAKGSLGELLYFDSVRINLGLIQKDTNVLYDLAIHDLSILSCLVNLEDVTEVAAHGTQFFGEQAEHVHLLLNFRSGFHAHIYVSWLSPVKMRQTIIGGKRAMILYDDTQPSEKLRIYDRGVEHDTTRPDPFFPKYRSGDIVIPALPARETLALEAEHVLRCVRGNEEPRCSGQDGLRIVRLLEAADRALKTSSTVRP